MSPSKEWSVDAVRTHALKRPVPVSTLGISRGREKVRVARKSMRPSLDCDRISQVIDEIYEGITDPESWSRALELLTGAFGASSSLICTPYSLPGCLTGLWVHKNLNASVFERYASHYMTTDLWLKALETAKPREGQVYVDRELVDPDTFARSEWFNDFLKPIDIEGVMVSVACQQAFGTERLQVGFFRPIGSKPFGEEQKRAFELIVGHFAQAWKLRSVVAQSQLRSCTADQEISRLGYGLVLVDKGGRIRFADNRALDVLRRGDGLVDRDGELTAIERSEAGRLRAILESICAARAANGHESACPALSISRREGKAAYEVHAFRRPFDLGPGALAAGSVVVVIVDPDQRVSETLKWAQAVWKLTAAEAAVVAEIIDGGSVAGHVQKRSISVETARWHLKNALMKAGLRSQRDLVRFSLNNR